MKSQPLLNLGIRAVSLLVVWSILNPNPHAEFVFTQGQFLTRFKSSVAPQDSGYFTPFTDSTLEMHFEAMTEALLADDVDTAQAEIDTLASLGVNYSLVRLRNTPFLVRGFMEVALPGDSDYHGWGAVLIRPQPAGYVVYQAPHVQYEAYTDDIAVQAMVENPNSLALILAGANRLANPDSNGDGWPDADVAHDSRSLFNTLHHHLALRGITNFTPYWFVQLHGAVDRLSEPTITGSNGAAQPQMTATQALVRIDDAVDLAGNITMGIWGWWEGPGDTEDGVYLLNGVINLQGDLLGFIGWRDSFLHFEIERQARNEYHAGSGEGYEGLLDLLEAIETELGAGIAPTAAPTWTPTGVLPTATPTKTPSPIPAIQPGGVLITLVILGIILWSIRAPR